MAGGTLVVRDPELKWPEEYRRFWFCGSAFLSNLMNAFSTVIPEGEHFFIESVRHYLDEIRDPVLRAQAITFVGQEGTHAREHRRYNEFVEAQGYPVRRMEQRVRRALDHCRAHLSPRSKLAVTCALEHYTTIIGAEFLRNPVCRESVLGEQARLWFWHSVEELEHTSVAFDVYRAIGGTYWERVREMIGITLGFWPLWLAITFAYQSHDRRLWSLREWWVALVWEFVRPGFVLRLVPRYLAYFRRDFHPSRYAGTDAALILEWRARLGLVPSTSDVQR